MKRPRLMPNGAYNPADLIKFLNTCKGEPLYQVAGTLGVTVDRVQYFYNDGMPLLMRQAKIVEAQRIAERARAGAL